MEFARLLHDNRPVWCILEGGTAYRVEGDLYASPTKGAALGPASSFKALNPIGMENKVVALLGNWGPQPTQDGPGVFVKPSNCLINPGDTVIYPEQATRVNLEPELGVIIGKTCTRVSPEEAKSRIFGYTVSNDVTAFETSYVMHFSPIYGKSFDTFGILGPKVVTDIDPTNVTLRCAINGDEFLQINSGLMTWNVFEIVSWVSKVQTLLPGDAISMGAPPGFDAKNVNPGDSMTITIDGIGSIENPVRRLGQA